MSLMLVEEQQVQLEVADPRVNDLVKPTARLELLASGFQFAEGPVWDDVRRCLFFSDIPANKMYRYHSSTGIAIHQQPSNFSNGMTLDHQGRLIVCEHQTRRVSRELSNGFEDVVHQYQGKQLNSPNDVIVSRDGSILFTDPCYGLMEGLGGPAEQELSFQGLFRVGPGAREARLLAEDFEAPNGLALTHDESKLFVTDTIRGNVRVFAVEPGWHLAGGEVFVELTGDEEGVPDGMKLDFDGNLFCAGPGGIWICSRSGRVLGRIQMPEVTSNLAWGDGDGSSLYITASTGLYRLQTLTGGPIPGGSPS
jgi:gluconolactonase